MMTYNFKIRLRVLRAFCSTVACLALLSACSSPSGLSKHPLFSQKQPLLLDVVDISSQLGDNPRNTSVNVPVTPQDLVMGWVHKRLEPAGSASRFVIETDKAYITRDGIGSSSHYTAYTSHYQLVMKLYGETSLLPERDAVMSIRFTREVEADATDAELAAFYETLLRETITKMDVLVPEHIGKYFPDIVIRTDS